MNTYDADFEKRFVANFIAFALTFTVTGVVVYFFRSVLSVACILVIVLAVMIVSASKRKFSILRWVSVVFVGVSSTLGCMYAVWGGLADLEGKQVSPIDGGTIFRTDEGIVISGPISSHSPIEWATVYDGDTRHRALPVFLDSRGGDIDAAKLIAAEIAKNNLEVRVAADARCQSACTLIFAAGSQRLADPKAFFQFHSSRYMISAPHLPSINILKQDDRDQFEGLRAFPDLLKNLGRRGAWRTNEGVSGSAQKLHDDQDATFLTLREMPETPSRDTK